MDDITYDTQLDGYPLTLDGDDGARYRVTVPAAMVRNELGEDWTDENAIAWIHANLAHILGAVTARETGGTIREPWGRLMVEELP